MYILNKEKIAMDNKKIKVLCDAFSHIRQLAGVQVDRELGLQPLQALHVVQPLRGLGCFTTGALPGSLG